jgi:teichuronic acid biosynthesis glycosyltransferase TuaG
MWLSILSILDYAYCYPFSLTLYRVHNNSLSNNKLKLIKYNYNIYYKYLNYNKYKSLFYLIRFLFFYFKFKLFSK